MKKEKLEKIGKYLNSNEFLGFLKSKKGHFCMFIIFYLIFLSVGLKGANTKPPTKSEYGPLYAQAKKLEENFGSIVEMKNASCNFDTGSMEVMLQSEKEHFLKVTFSYNLDKIVKYEEFDNIVSIYWILIKSLFFTLFLTIFAILLLCYS